MVCCIVFLESFTFIHVHVHVRTYVIFLCLLLVKPYFPLLFILRFRFASIIGVYCDVLLSWCPEQEGSTVFHFMFPTIPVQFHCPTGTRGLIPRNWLCDGYDHCWNGEDEENCVGKAAIFLTSFSPLFVCMVICDSCKVCEFTCLSGLFNFAMFSTGDLNSEVCLT